MNNNETNSFLRSRAETDLHSIILQLEYKHFFNSLRHFHKNLIILVIDV